VFIARPDISATQAEGLTEQFATFVEENGGAIKLREQWGLRTLAYRIRKNRKGHYALLNIEAPAPVIEEMNRLMRLNEDIMRHLTVRVDELSSEPSIMMTSRASRDDRDRDRGDRPRRREFNRDSSGPGGGRGGDREDSPKRDTDGPKEETSE
jgi:small subunit ribosomal protein S6